MGGIARLAKQMGYRVSGSDENVYPPMSTQLESLGIALSQGYDREHLRPVPDTVVVGNVMARGNSVVEYLLNHNIPFASGPEWLRDHVLCDRWVLAVAGTHGKTSTSSLLAWILDYAGLEPGFLIGGVARNFGITARLGKAPFFVLEADEYDTAFFDKRSKFVHYYPRTLIMNNLEYDHADIFDDLNAIKRQFHQLIRIVPSEGLIISNAQDQALSETLAMGCWTPQQQFAVNAPEIEWNARLLSADGSQFELRHQRRAIGVVQWSQLGEHNVSNALAAVAAAHHAGVPVERSMEALARFQGVKRRLEVRGHPGGVTLYDDFAHHPTAIKMTLAALRAQVGQHHRIVAVLEPRSNTMRMGVHKELLPNALADANYVVIYQPANLKWSLAEAVASLGEKVKILDSIEAIVNHVAAEVGPGDHVLVMSNGGFGGLHALLENELSP